MPYSSLKYLFLDSLLRLDFAFNLLIYATNNNYYIRIAGFMKIRY